ncbi:CHAT domain-containing protein [Nonomuraea sp. NPDC003707]
MREKKRTEVLVLLFQMALEAQEQYDTSGHPDHLRLAIHMWSRFSDVLRGERRLAAAVLGAEVISHALNELGLDLLAAADGDTGTARLREAAEALLNAAEWAEPGSAWRTSVLINVSHVRVAAWERGAAEADLDGAVAAAEAAVTPAPEAATRQPTARNVLGNALRTRGKHTGHVDDLRRAVTCHGEAVTLTGSGTPDSARFLINLGWSQRALFAATSDPAMIDAAVATFTQARQEVCDERDLLPALEGLQSSLGERGAPADLLAQAEVLATIADEHSGLPLEAATLILLAAVLTSYAMTTPDLDALDRAVAAARRARDLSADEPYRGANARETLARGLSARFTVSASLGDLDEAIVLRRQSLLETPQPTAASQDGRVQTLALLSRDLHQRYESTGDPLDAEAGLQAAREALELTGQNDPERAGRRMDFSWWLNTRYRRTGDPADLDQAIAGYEDAVDLLEPGSLAWLQAIASLGGLLTTRFQATGDHTHLARAVSRAETALREWGHAPDVWLAQAMLANALLARESMTGDDADLDRALALYDTIEGNPRATPYDLLVMVDHAATALARRADRTGRRSDDRRALRMIEEAVKLDLAPQHRAAALESLARMLLDRANQTHNLAVAREAAQAAHEAATLTLPGSIRRLDVLELQGVIEHVVADIEDRPADDAIALLRQALAETEASAPAFPRVLTHLAGARAQRADRAGDAEEAARALADADRALELIEDSGPMAGVVWRHRASALRTRFQSRGDGADRVAATSAFRRAIDAEEAFRLRPAIATAREWLRWAAQREAWDEVIEAGERGLALTTRLLRRQVGRSDREGALDEAPILAQDLAYGLARKGRLGDAVTQLERGRAILLAEPLRRNQADLGALRADGHAVLADRFEAAVARMRALDAGELRPQAEAPLGRPWAPSPAEHERHRAQALVAASEELERAILAIRTTTGHGEFLNDPGFPVISDPIVYLAGTTSGGLCLIAHPGGVVEVLWPDGFAASQVRAHTAEWLTAYQRRGTDPDGWTRTFDATTRWLWTAAVGPLLEHLRGRERATLIPGGLLGLLPLHAAWTPDAATPSGRRYALDELLLTYAPSATILDEASGLPAHLPQSLLAIAEPQPVSAGRLPWATREVNNAARGFSSVALLAGADATHTAVTEHLDGHDVLHFACHGSANTTDPRRSGLLLANDQLLALSDLASMRLTDGRGGRPRLAVLSACESGIPGTTLPDEVIGIPAAFLAAGVHGVVSSLFTVPDLSTGLLMTRFYETWTEGREPAEALRTAQRWLRDVTNEQLHAAYGKAVVVNPPAASAARRLWDSARPFAQPARWAGFTYAGA